MLQERVHRTRIGSPDVDHLKQSIMEEWSQFDQAIVDRAVEEWRLAFASLRASEWWSL